MDINNWKRKEHYEFFSKYDEPFWGVVSEIDCTEAYEKSKENVFSFFLYYLHKSILALNEIEEFKYRIRDGKIIVFDKINVATTIGRPDETFGYSFIEYEKDFNKFLILANNEILRINNSTGLSLTENSKRLDVIHYSSLPWTKFTGLSHARDFKNLDSIPKVVFGKFMIVNGRKIMNVSLNAHHGLADGIHAAKFFELFQKLMNE
ncbi:MAG: chloramphenicol acetyltransferase [Bacteroidetes bacterium]|nr:chloramphenicol acetyltransferase [Bacteroidota bacterium]MBU1799491.1 chloramphenicol acetyltransferase [Bacteroidota bacterium]